MLGAIIIYFLLFGLIMLTAYLIELYVRGR